MHDLQGASRVKAEFVATLSHDIRTPLNHIAGYSEMLADGAFEPYSPQWDDAVGRIQQGVRELLDRIIILLELAQVGAGRTGTGFGRARTRGRRNK